MTRSDYLTLAAVAAVVLAAVVGVAAAVEVTGQQVPDEAEVGQPTEATITLENLYTNYENWTLVAQTGLDDPRWNVTYYDQTGAVVETKEVEGATYNGVGISPDKNIARVVVEVEGSTPAVQGNYTYEGQNEFSMMQLSQQPEEGAVQTPFQTWETVHYTQASRDAREALDAARAAIDEASGSGVDVTEAENLFQSALSSYRAGNFQNAQNLAQQAQTNAENKQNQSQQESQQLQLILLGVGAVVVILIVAGGIYYYRQSQQKQTRLR